MGIISFAGFETMCCHKNNKIHGISLPSSGIVGVYSPFAVRFLSANTGSPVSLTFKLEKNLSIKDGIQAFSMVR